MRALLVLSILMVASATPSRAADPPKLAVFDFEMLDTSQEGRMPAKRTDEQERLMRIGDQLRKELGESGKFRVLDVSPVNAAAHQSNLQSCGGCDVKLAQQLGADLEITGVVQKVSNVILNMTVFLRDAHTGRLVTAANADMPGNTDETWSHTTHYLVHERLLAPNYGRPQAN